MDINELVEIIVDQEDLPPSYEQVQLEIEKEMEHVALTRSRNVCIQISLLLTAGVIITLASWSSEYNS